MTPEQIQAEIAKIDAQIIALEGGLDRIPAEHEDGRSSDDNATEAEMVQQDVDGAAFNLQGLRERKQELQEMLDAA